MENILQQHGWQLTIGEGVVMNIGNLRFAVVILMLVIVAINILRAS